LSTYQLVGSSQGSCFNVSVGLGIPGGAERKVGFGFSIKWEKMKGGLEGIRCRCCMLLL
jgi:hypothetical protein